MAIKIKSVDKGLFKMEKTAKDLDGRKINVGYLQGGEQAWLAAIHEYGCVIKITPKMRNWLHANGLHVKNTTKEIVIPERSYLRAGFDEHHKLMSIKPSEVSRVLLEQLQGVKSNAEYEEVGTVLQVSDGVVRIYGLYINRK